MARPHWWDCPLESLTHLVITWDIKDHVSKSLNQGVAHCVKRALFIMWLIKVTKVKAHLGWQDPNTKCEAQFSEEQHLGESSRQDTQLYVCILKDKGHAFRLFGRSAKEVIDTNNERLSLNKGGGNWHQLPLSLHEIPVHTLNHVTWTNHMIGGGVSGPWPLTGG